MHPPSAPGGRNWPSMRAGPRYRNETPPDRSSGSGGALPEAIKSVLGEEADELRRSIRPLRVGVRAVRAPARPGVAGLVDGPLLHEWGSVALREDPAGVVVATGH